MAVDPTIVAELLELSKTDRIASIKYLKVTWDTGVVKYYSTIRPQQTPPFIDINLPIEARLIGSPFDKLELNPDLRSETNDFEFDDIDGVIKGLFQTYKSGVNAEVHRYWPSVDTDETLWKGQLQAPDIYGLKTTRAKLTNGFRSREMPLPRRRRPRECTTRVFGGALPTAFAVRSNLCPYDRHVGGSTGLLNGSDPFTDCTFDEAGCMARFGHKLFFGGFNPDAAAVMSGNNSHPYLSISNDNSSKLTQPIRVVAGTKYVRGNLQLFWRRYAGGANPDHGWVGTLWEICEGPVQSISGFIVNEKTIEQEHVEYRLGTRGQAKTSYATDVSNLSSTAHVNTMYGWVNPFTLTPSTMSSEGYVSGFSEVHVYSDATTFSLAYSEDRVWWILESMLNQKWGFGYGQEEFAIPDWITESVWGQTMVTRTFQASKDGEVNTTNSRRTMFHAILDGHPAVDQITDMCRSGGLSVPFQYDGKLTIRSLRAATDDELAAARVFTDRGTVPNIVTVKGVPTIQTSQVPADKLTNTIHLSFEEAANKDVERPITVRDRDQMLLAGRKLGTNLYEEVPKTYAALGVNNLAEALGLARRNLMFGEFDDGGTQNNLETKFYTPEIWTVGLKRYEIIKIESELLDGFESPTGDPFVYFRIKNLVQASKDTVLLTVQAYNHAAAVAFETEMVSPPPPPPGGGAVAYVSRCGTLAARGNDTYAEYGYNGEVNGHGQYVFGIYQIMWDSGSWILTDGANTLYTAVGATVYPWDVSLTWTVVDGIAPACTVREFPPFGGGGCMPEITSASYNPTTGTIDVNISPC